MLNETDFETVRERHVYNFTGFKTRTEMNFLLMMPTLRSKSTQRGGAY